ncbi:MAG TPA: cell division ATPase MinD [Candidatus Norongarragalinales archaeon]|nr:cell division ATPase MinD [Candidatus Norongarragalinales archaeon]
MSGRTIGIISGKGGTGKTSVSVNLALLLSQAGKRVVVVDADTAMANVGILLGVEKAPINLHNVLMGESDIKDAIYDGPFGLKYVPSGLSLERVRRLDYTRLKSAVATLALTHDFVFVDCPPGIGREVEGALASVAETMIVMTPDPVSLSDALKGRAVSDKAGSKAMGIVLNMVTGEKNEIQRKDLENLFDLKVLAELPFDLEVRKSAIAQVPVVIRAPNTAFVQRLKGLASLLLGAPLPEQRVKKSFLQSIINALMFWKKK